MKIPALLTCLLAVVLSALPMSQARAADVSFDVFYNSLADDGDWYNTPEYGYVWQPTIGYQNDKWRPYSDGYWAQTDDGWTWVSYENFGWATYHYGRWTRLESTGWVWVPGYDWGPGWVSWRSNDDYVGWAPLPPKHERRGGGGSGSNLVVDYNTVESEEGYNNSVDEQYDIGPSNYCFVATTDFGAPVLREVLVPQQRNVVIIENTVNVTNITYRRGPNYVVVHNYGPDFEFLRTRVHRPIQELRIERRDNVDFLRDQGNERHNPNVVRDGVFQIAAPNINRQRVNFNEVRPTRVKEELRDPRVEHGWRNSGADQPTVERLRNQFQQQARDRATRPPGNPTANIVPAPNDPRRDGNRGRDQANVPPTPAATNQPFNRTEDDRRARRDAAQRDRETRENARANGGQLTPGTDREARRQPGAPDQAQPTVPPQANPNQNPRGRGPRPSDAPVATPPTATPPAADNPRGDRQSQRRVHQDAQPSAAPDATPRENRRVPRPQEAPQATPAAPDATPRENRRNSHPQEAPQATPAAQNPPAEDRRAARRQEQEQRQQAQTEQTRAREQQQQQRVQEQATQRQQEQAQRQQAAPQRQPEQAPQRQPEQAPQRQPEQAQRRQEPQAQPPQNQPAKSDDDKKKRRDGQPGPQ